MIFGSPVEFEDALKASKVKAVLPTSLSAAEIAKISPELREVVRFSARTTNARYISAISQAVDEILTPHTETREDGSPVTKGLDYATARTRLRDELTAIGYEPDAGERGGITDLASDQRLNLVIKMNVDLAEGYGRWAQGQNAEVLDQWPAQELYRAEDRMEPRDWPSRWAAAGGQFFEGGDYPEGRMVALKNDPIWEEISAFGIPYPPFDYNSGMDVRDVTREEAEDLGLIEKGEKVEPEERDFSKDVEASVKTMTPELQNALLADLGDGYAIVDGVLTAANEEPGHPFHGNQWTEGGGEKPYAYIAPERLKREQDVFAAADEFRKTWPDKWKSHEGQEITAAILDGANNKRVARDNWRKIVGAIAYHIDPDDAAEPITITHLGSVQKGVGSKLVSLVQKKAKAVGRDIYIESTPNAEGFYEKLGFEHHDKEQSKLMRWRHTQDIANEGGQPCGDGWISPEDECHVGGGSAPADDVGAKGHVFTSGRNPEEPEMHGVRFVPIKEVRYGYIKDHVEEPPIPKLYPKQHFSTGAVIVEPDDRVWLVKPKGKFGGYRYTLPKGTVEPEAGLSPQQNAHKEIHEETGLVVKLGKYVGDYQGDTSVTRFYTAKRVSGSPAAFKPEETEAVVLVPVEQAMKLLNRYRDRKALADATNRHDLLPKELPKPKYEKKSKPSIWGGLQDDLFKWFGNELLTMLGANEGGNCGTGAGGFQPGNSCAKDGDGDGPHPPVIYHTYDSATEKPYGKKDTIRGRGIFALPPSAFNIRGKQYDPFDPNEYGDTVVALHLNDVPKEKIFTAAEQFDAVKQLFGDAAHKQMDKDMEDDLIAAYKKWDDKIADEMRRRGIWLVHYTNTEQYGHEWAVMHRDAIKGKQHRAGKFIANEGGQPCGDGWISGDKECHVGQGSAGESNHVPLSEGHEVTKFGKTASGNEVNAWWDAEHKKYVVAEQDAEGNVKQFGLFATSAAASAAGFKVKEGGKLPSVPIPKPAAEHPAGWDVVKNASDLPAMKKVGGQLGSNPGGVYELSPGVTAYVKDAKSAAHARNEWAANQLYSLAGVQHPEVSVHKAADGSMKIVSKWEQGEKFDPDNSAHRAAAQHDFAVHAWLGNWDAIGTGNDNQKLSGGKALTVDSGGALYFRAQGGTKEFGSTPTEWDTMRDVTKNAYAAKVFSEMSAADLKASASKLLAVKDADIDHIAAISSPVGNAKAFADTLKERRDWILLKTGLKTPDEVFLAHVGKTPEAKPEPIITPAEVVSVAAQAAAETKVLGKDAKPLKQVQTIDVTEWPSHNSTAHWAANKIAAMEAAYDNGDIEGLKQNAYDLSKTKSPNPYQKATAAAYKSLLDKLEAKANDTTALDNWVAGVPKPPTTESAVNGPTHNAKVNALYNAALTGDIAKLSAIGTNANAVQTYAKKQHAYKTALVAHLTANPSPKPGTAPTAKPAAEPKPAVKTAPEKAPAMPKITPKIDPASIPKPPEFISSNVANVTKNKAEAAALYEMAKAGKLDMLKAHPQSLSPKLNAYKDSLVSHIDSVLNPPPPPEPPKPMKDLKGVFKELHESFPVTAKKGIYNDIGRYHVLGTYKPLEGSMGTFEKTKDFDNPTSALQKKHEAAYNALPMSDRAQIKSYTGGGYITQNPEIMKKEPGSSGVQAGLAIEKAAREIPEGTWLARKFTFNDPKDDVKLAASVGKVLQDPAIISTSVSTTAWSGNVTVHMKTGPGVRGLYVGGTISSHKSEREMIMVPNQRILIQKVEKTAHGTQVYAYVLPTMPNQVSSTVK